MNIDTNTNALCILYTELLLTKIVRRIVTS